MSTRVHVVMSDELLATVDVLRGDGSRSAWLRAVARREVLGLPLEGRRGEVFVSPERLQQALVDDDGRVRGRSHSPPVSDAMVSRMQAALYKLSDRRLHRDEHMRAALEAALTE